MTPTCEKRLEGVHPDLVAVVRRAAENGASFRVTCGLRTRAEQEALLAAGKSRTTRSRHLTGHAVDLVHVPAPRRISYAAADMAALNDAMQAAAAELGVPLEWGGDWRTFKDTPHWQLPWADYPADGAGKRKPAAKPQPARTAEDAALDAAQDAEIEREPEAGPSPSSPPSSSPPKPLAGSRQVHAGTAEAAGGVLVQGITWQEIWATAKGAGGIVPALSGNPLLAVLLGASLGMIALGLYQVWERRRKRRQWGV